MEPKLYYIMALTMAFLTYLHRVAVSRGILSEEEAEDAMNRVLAGEATSAQIAGFLVALRMRGETADELTGFARSMRKHMVAVEIGRGEETLIDTCGTGGDGHNTFNISTVAAFVLAGAGLRVAKHGNRSVSSAVGSADVLEALGVRITIPVDRMAACIREAGFGFLFAPDLHPAMKHAMPARRELKMRTAFNLLGPLANPASAEAQLIGAPSEESARLMAEALARLGMKNAMVVHGSDGMDEVTTTGSTLAYTVRGGSVKMTILQPEDFGVPRASLGDLVGGDREENASIARAILRGLRGPKRDIVLVNAAAALVAADEVSNFGSAMKMAERSIDSGAALDRLERLVRVSNTLG